MQMKMFLTRLGENSRMIVAGDPSQVDLPPGAKSGLQDATDILGKVDGISMVRFGESDVVRHPLVSKMVQAYNARDKRLEAERKKRRDKQAREAAEPPSKPSEE
jgi:phosphate starvation-inducible PhoH-like protein